MGKGAKKAERLQELEQINHNIQAENAELRRLLQVPEEEKQELQERSQLHGEVLNGIIEELQLELQTKDDLLAKLQLGERMEDKEPSTVDAQTQTEVCVESISSCSLSSQYDNNVGMKLLTKMGYKGGGLGINGQGVTQSLEVVQRPPFADLAFGKVEIGEWSKTAKARATSTSLDSNRGAKVASPHQNCNKDKPGRYKSHSNYFLEYKKNDFCIRSSNRDVAKHHMKKVWVKKTNVSTGSETKKKPHLPSPSVRNAWLNGKRRNFCSYCKINGHWEKKCWKLHPEICHKPRSRQIMKEPVKKEAPSTIVKARLQCTLTLICDMNHSFLLLLYIRFFTFFITLNSIQFSSAIKNCHLLIWLMNSNYDLLTILV
jgi:hypothetical protein